MVCPSARGGGGGGKKKSIHFPPRGKNISNGRCRSSVHNSGQHVLSLNGKNKHQAISLFPPPSPPQKKKMEQRGFVHQGKKWVTSRPPPRELTASGPCLSGAARREMKANVSITNSITRPYAGFFAVLGADQCRVGEARKNGVFPCPLIGFVFVLSETVAVLSG